MIYVINSARMNLSRHILENDKDCLIIADECHHYGSIENGRIFEFRNYFQKNYYSLGLSATPFKGKNKKNLINNLGEEIFTYSFIEAKRNNIINDFFFFKLGVSLSQSEAELYLELCEKISRSLNIFLTKNHLNDFSGDIVELLTSFAATDELASTILTLFYRRSELLYLADDRINCAYDLISRLSMSAKIIIFCERISQAEMLYNKLNKTYNDVGIYHSKMAKELKIKTLRDYKENIIRILVSCKALDEGLNIPKSDVGIIMSSTMQRSQKIQRIGRIIRKKAPNQYARLYYIYVTPSVEANHLNESINDLFGQTYVSEIFYRKHRFYNKEYLKVCQKTISILKNSNITNEQMQELKPYFKRGIVNYEWLLSLDELDYIDENRKYLIAMKLLIKNKG